MTLTELDTYFKSFLHPENYPSDPSRNGIQIENSNPDEKEIKKIAFAVDACKETVELAAKEKADVLFVHHGLFWGDCECITKSHYKRIAAFIQNDIALYACHIPLDANNPYGNNYGIAARLNLKDMQPFGFWRGMSIGVMGKLEKSLDITRLAEKCLNPNEKPLCVLPFGKEKISTVGIISGGAADDVSQAIEQNLDAFITGEFNHELYHYVKENKINVIAAGHYQSETVGVNLVMKKIQSPVN